MAKRSATARRNAQRQKTTRSKGFELVLPETEESEEESALVDTEAVTEAEQEEKLTSGNEDEKISEEEVEKPVVAEKKARSKKVTTAAKAEVKEAEPEVAPVTGSARARLAASRQNKARNQRAAAQMITVEHFKYVKRDLITIAVLATFLFAVIIFLYVAYGSVL